MPLLQVISTVWFPLAGMEVALPLVSPPTPCGSLGANGGLQEAPDKCLSLFTCEEWPRGLVLSKCPATSQGPPAPCRLCLRFTSCFSGTKGIGLRKINLHSCGGGGRGVKREGGGGEGIQSKACVRGTVVSEGDCERQSCRLHSFLHFALVGWARPEQILSACVWIRLSLHRQTLPFPPGTSQGQRGPLLDSRLDVGRGRAGQESPGHEVHGVPSASPG